MKNMESIDEIRTHAFLGGHQRLGESNQKEVNQIVKEKMMMVDALDAAKEHGYIPLFATAQAVNAYNGGFTTFVIVAPSKEVVMDIVLGQADPKEMPQDILDIITIKDSKDGQGAQYATIISISKLNRMLTEGESLAYTVFDHWATHLIMADEDNSFDILSNIYTKERELYNRARKMFVIPIVEGWRKGINEMLSVALLMEDKLADEGGNEEYLATYYNSLFKALRYITKVKAFTEKRDVIAAEEDVFNRFGGPGYDWIDPKELDLHDPQMRRILEKFKSISLKVGKILSEGKYQFNGEAFDAFIDDLAQIEADVSLDVSLKL